MATSDQPSKNIIDGQQESMVINDHTHHLGIEPTIKEWVGEPPNED